VKKRSWVLALLCAVSVITFLDRLAVAVAEPGIRGDLGLDASQWGWVLSAYVLANALFEIPSGALGDRKGRRFELTRIAVWWSGFTALTGACRSFWQVAGTRFLFGVGAAGAYPNAAGVISRWFPRREHARAQGFVWGASRLGGALAPLLLVPLQRVVGWRMVFGLLGVVGMVWAVIWGVWFRDDPARMAGMSAGELEEIGVGRGVRGHGGAPWRRLLGLRQLWLITAAYFCYAWGSWFYFGWFTTWLVRGAGFSVRQMGVVASFPFVMGLVGNLVGGVVSERLVERYGRRVAYRWVTCVCLLATAGLLGAMSLRVEKTMVVVLATLGLGVMDLMLPSAWAMCMSLGGSYGGTATGVMNTAGNLGGWVGAIVFGYVVKATGSYDAPLRLIAGMVLVSAVLFGRVDCTAGLAEVVLPDGPAAA
jgi:ACS family glucarate transporter-like MFS transporter